jgi:hypothetical protein
MLDYMDRVLGDHLQLVRKSDSIRVCTVMVSCAPLRPVAPEHASRASSIRIEGCVCAGSLLHSKWWAIDAPAKPPPMITISAVVGSSSVLRWRSSLCGEMRQKEASGDGAGVGVSGIVVLAVDSTTTCLPYTLPSGYHLGRRGINFLSA